MPERAGLSDAGLAPGHPRLLPSRTFFRTFDDICFYRYSTPFSPFQIRLSCVGGSRKKQSIDDRWGLLGTHWDNEYTPDFIQTEGGVAPGLVEGVQSSRAPLFLFLLQVAFYLDSKAPWRISGRLSVALIKNTAQAGCSSAARFAALPTSPGAA